MSSQSPKDLFHDIGGVLPEEQDLVRFDLTEQVESALSMMLEKKLSQVPVFHNSEFFGSFSFRSFAKGLLQLKKGTNPLTLPVEEFLEDLQVANRDHLLTELFEELEAKDAVMVGYKGDVHGLVTTIDALRYFYEVASAYVLFGEIELSLRELIRHSVTDEEELRQCMSRVLGHLDKEVPQKLEMTSLDDLIGIVRHKAHWEKFSSAFGGTSDTVNTKFKGFADMRNKVFHFRGELTVGEYDSLRDVRDWLARRIKKISAD